MHNCTTLSTQVLDLQELVDQEIASDSLLGKSFKAELVAKSNKVKLELMKNNKNFLKYADE